MSRRRARASAGGARPGRRDGWPAGPPQGSAASLTGEFAALGAANSPRAYALEDVNEALDDLRRGRLTGAGVGLP